MSEYDPLIPRRADMGSDDLDRVRERFSTASQAYLASPIPWLVWAIVLPGASLATPRAAEGGGVSAVVALWSISVLLGGLVEGALILRRRRSSTPLGSWVMRVQGNQSMVGLALSIFLIWQGLPTALPGVWLLLVGSSFFVIGGLALGAMRQAGVIYQVGGLVALWPQGRPFVAFALATAIGNLWIAVALLRRERSSGGE